MIILKDSIEIRTTPERIFDWFKNLDKHFTEWHPNHTKFVKVTGGMDEGDIIYFEERLGGKLNKYKGKISKIEMETSDWKLEIEYLFPASLLGVRSLIVVESKEDTCIFTICETFGFKKPIVGKLIDF